MPNPTIPAGGGAVSGRIQDRLIDFADRAEEAKNIVRAIHAMAVGDELSSDPVAAVAAIAIERIDALGADLKQILEEIRQ